jgi:hypothetical protein
VVNGAVETSTLDRPKLGECHQTVPLLTSIVIAEAIHGENSDSWMAWRFTHWRGNQKGKQSESA